MHFNNKSIFHRAETSDLNVLQLGRICELRSIPFLWPPPSNRVMVRNYRCKSYIRNQQCQNPVAWDMREPLNPPYNRSPLRIREINSFWCKVPLIGQRLQRFSLAILRISHKLFDSTLETWSLVYSSRNTAWIKYDTCTQHNARVARIRTRSDGCDHNGAMSQRVLLPFVDESSLIWQFRFDDTKAFESDLRD